MLDSSALLSSYSLPPSSKGSLRTPLSHIITPIQD
ncbi:hypothetical protein [Caudoviricetes sp.]|nr:hypothetical protein [Caudoviricetes sp.]